MQGYGLGDLGIDGRTVLRYVPSEVLCAPAFSSHEAGSDHNIFFSGVAAAERPAVTAAVAAVSVHTTTAATAKNGHIISGVDTSCNAAADIVFVAGVCSRRSAASATGPYFIFSRW